MKKIRQATIAALTFLVGVAALATPAGANTTMSTSTEGIVSKPIVFSFLVVVLVLLLVAFFLHNRQSVGNALTYGMRRDSRIRKDVRRDMSLTHVTGALFPDNDTQ